MQRTVTRTSGSPPLLADVESDRPNPSAGASPPSAAAPGEAGAPAAALAALAYGLISAKPLSAAPAASPPFGVSDFLCVFQDLRHRGLWSASSDGCPAHDQPRRHTKTGLKPRHGSIREPSALASLEVVLAVQESYTCSHPIPCYSASGYAS